MPRRPSVFTLDMVADFTQEAAYNQATAIILSKSGS